MTASRSLVLAGALLLAPALVAVPAVAHTSGELPRPTSTSPVSVTHPQDVPPLPQITRIRTGRHDTFDRIVLDVHGDLPSYAVRYVSEVAGPSGEPVPVRGRAILAVDVSSVDVEHAPARPSLAGLRDIRDVVLFEAFEGHLGWGVGVSDRNGFRVFELRSPNRIVVDVAHTLPAPTSTAPVVGSLGGTEVFEVTGFRAGQHPAYDRVVFDIDGGGDYRVAYDDGALLVTLTFATYDGPATVRTGLRQAQAVRVVARTSRTLTFQLVLDHRAGFRVFGLHAPSRIAIDVAR
jgi:AMIN domain